jgi:hypothetical protein
MKFDGRLLLANLMFCLYFNPEDEGSVFFRNINQLLPHYRSFITKDLAELTSASQDDPGHEVTFRKRNSNHIQCKTRQGIKQFS